MCGEGSLKMESSLDDHVVQSAHEQRVSIFKRGESQRIRDRPYKDKLKKAEIILFRREEKIDNSDKFHFFVDKFEEKEALQLPCLHSMRIRILIKL